MTILQAKFEIAGWDEQPFDEGDGTAKLTEATVTKSYTGAIEGSSTTKWLMAYSPDGTATFVGLERIAGAVDGRTGTLVLQHIGQFANGAARAELTVVSGTAELASVTGSGDFLADPAGSVTLDLSGP
jgi:hypothetical protein